MFFLPLWRRPISGGSFKTMILLVIVRIMTIVPKTGSYPGQNIHMSPKVVANKVAKVGVENDELA